jgi:hypothetical protein
MGGNIFVFNNTLNNVGTGIQSDYYSTIVYNNIVQNCTDGYLVGGGGSFSISSDNNISDIAGDAPNATFSTVAKSVAFLDEANDDFHLSPNDTSARNMGTSSLFVIPTGGFAEWRDPSVLNYDIDGTPRGASFDIGADEVPTEFVSTICENASAGGSCAQVDYNTLARWEDKVESDLTATSTRVFSGTLTGTLAENDVVTLYRGASSTGITGTVVATTSAGQILVDSISAGLECPGHSVSDSDTECREYPLSVAQGDVWRLDGSNYFTASGTGDALGASPIAVAKIDGAWNAGENAGVTVDDWNTSHDNYIKIYTTELARHKGRVDDGYRISLDSPLAALRLFENYARIDGLNLQTDINSDSYGFVQILASADAPGTEIHFSNNIVYKRGLRNSIGIFFISASQQITTARIWNNILISDVNSASEGGTGIQLNTAGAPLPGPIYIYNNTVYNFYRNIYNPNAGGAIYAKNNIALKGGQYDFYNGGSAYGTSSDYNISTDNTAPGSHSQHGVTLQFANLPAHDFHLSQFDTAARGMGVSLAADPYLPFTTDIDGQTRTGSWSIGADDGPVVVINSPNLVSPPPGGPTSSKITINPSQVGKIARGLVGYWSFNGPDVSLASSTAYDRSGFGNDGTIHGAVPVIGKRGQGMSFDGGQYLSISDPGVGSVLDMQDELSISVWINSSNISSNADILSKVPNNDNEWNYSLGISNDSVEFYFRNGDPRTHTTIAVLQANKWHHLTAIYNDLENFVKIYIDGNLALNEEETYSLVVNNGPMFIGRDGYGDYFNGKIDEVRVYDRVLSADEIGDLYRLGNGKLRR